MVEMKVVVVACDADGNVDLDDLHGGSLMRIWRITALLVVTVVIQVAFFPH